MKCSQCGINLLADSNFCHGCGTPVKTEGDVADGASVERVFKAKDATTLIWQTGESGVKIKLAASDLSASPDEDEYKVYSIEELVRLIRDNPDIAKKEEAEYDPNEMIFHIFTAWR
jgi:hypothetical protein